MPLPPIAVHAAQFQGSPVRLLIIPGLHDSGRWHWQTWLQTQYRGAVRVRQQNWDRPELEVWSEQIARTIASAPASTAWIAVAHSFGCLALAHHLARLRQQPAAGLRRADNHQGGIRSALLVAPADPAKFQVEDRLPQNGLGIPATVVASETDPWMTLSNARRWAGAWGARLHNLGDAGHINTESGYGPWPWIRFRTDSLIRDEQRQRRLERAHPLELNYAI